MESEKFKSQHAKGSVSLKDIDKMTSSRVIKTHLPFYLLHPRLFDICKVRLELNDFGRRTRIYYKTLSFS